MMKEIGLFLILLMMVSISLAGCSNTENKKSSSEIHEVRDLINREVYVIEGEELVPYIVASNDYNGKTLLLRMHLLEDDMRMNEYHAYYENCEMDQYLNNEFYSKFSLDMQNIIVETQIEVVRDDYFRSDITVISIPRKVFLLSSTEIGQTVSFQKEGEPIDYFDKAEKLIASTEGYPSSSWWLRSADITYESCFYAVGPKAEIGSTNAFSVNGIRPAFCVSGDTEVVENTELFADRIVYRIK